MFCPRGCLLWCFCKVASKQDDDQSTTVLDTNKLKTQMEIVNHMCFMVSRTTALDEIPPVFLFVKRMLGCVLQAQRHESIDSKSL